jgi:glycosyltransferase involved in cell wall biosynthesis
MKRGLVLSKYGDLAAATRQRFMLAAPYLQKENIELDFQPLFDNAYLDHLFNKGKRSPFTVAKAYVKRLLVLLRSNEYDFVWVHLELFPYLPLEWLIRLTRKSVIYDFDDAIFHQYDQHTNPWVRRFLGNKLHPLLKRSNLAFCGNAYLQAYAAQHCAHTVVIPTTVDMDVYTERSASSSNPPVLGWIGSPSTWPYVAAIHDVLRDDVNAQKLKVLVVGANHAADRELPFEYRAWAENREIADIHEMDIGVMPIPDAPWARGKCGYKLIQYMACGLPVIASPVGVNTTIVQHGVNGYLAANEAQWREAISALLSDAELRKKMGQAGRQRVIAEYSIQRYGPEMAKLIHDLV